MAATGVSNHWGARNLFDAAKLAGPFIDKPTWPVWGGSSFCEEKGIRKLTENEVTRKQAGIDGATYEAKKAIAASRYEAL